MTGSQKPDSTSSEAVTLFEVSSFDVCHDVKGTTPDTSERNHGGTKRSARGKVVSSLGSSTPFSLQHRLKSSFVKRATFPLFLVLVDCDR